MAEFSWTLSSPTVDPRSTAQRRRGSGDVRLYNTADGGEIDIVNGELVKHDGFETAVYLSLFGGNEDDSGLEVDDRRQWWGNFGEAQESRQYRSQTQYLLRSLPVTDENLRRLEDAAEHDLAWLTVGWATFVRVTADVPALNQIHLVVEVEIDGRQLEYEFTENWRSQR